MQLRNSEQVCRFMIDKLCAEIAGLISKSLVKLTQYGYQYLVFIYKILNRYYFFNHKISLKFNRYYKLFCGIKLQFIIKICCISIPLLFISTELKNSLINSMKFSTSTL